MSLRGRAILAIWNDIAPGGDHDFNEWHTREHMPERLAVPGFLRGRRYVALRGAPRYFNFYETDGPEVLQSPPYLERLNHPTPWTRRCIQLFRNNKRTVCTITASLGRGEGGVVATVELGPGAGREEGLRAWLREQALPAVLARPGISSVHLGEADVAATIVRTAEKRLLDRPDALARWVVLVEGNDAAAVEAAQTAVLAPAALAAQGAEDEVLVAVYQLAFSLDRGE
jgi:hypothetical protein